MSRQLLKVGDRILAYTEYNGCRVVEVTEIIEDVSRQSGLEPGPGFIGLEEVIPGHFEELVYADSQFVEFAGD